MIYALITVGYGSIVICTGKSGHSQFRTGVALITCRSTAFIKVDAAPKVWPEGRYVALLLGGSVTGSTPTSWLTIWPAPPGDIEL